MFLIKKSKRLFSLAIIIGGLIFSSCSQINFNRTPSLAGSEYQIIEINPEHQTCEKAEDCIITYVDCSGCECGIPINLDYEYLYKELYTDYCAEYTGPVCEMYCPPVTLICKTGICAAVPSD